MKDNWGNVSQKHKRFYFAFNVKRLLHVAYALFDIEVYMYVGS